MSANDYDISNGAFMVKECLADKRLVFRQLSEGDYELDQWRCLERS